METKENFKIEIFQDQIAINPFKEWDCEPPISVVYGRYGAEDYQKEDIINAIEDKLTKAIISRHLSKIVDILDFDLEYTKAQGYSVEERNDEIRDQINSLILKDLAKICEIVNIPHKMHGSTGYSQGDWAEVLIVLTDKFLKTTGADPRNAEEILEETAKLFDQWAWGDVYGFTLYKRVNYTKTYEDGRKVKSFEWEEVDSCCGFYGREWEENGIMEHIPEEAHYLFDDIEVTY